MPGCMHVAVIHRHRHPGRLLVRNPKLVQGCSTSCCRRNNPAPVVERENTCWRNSSALLDCRNAALVSPTGFCRCCCWRHMKRKKRLLQSFDDGQLELWSYSPLNKLNFGTDAGSSLPPETDDSLFFYNRFGSFWWWWWWWWWFYSSSGRFECALTVCHLHCALISDDLMIIN